MPALRISPGFRSAVGRINAALSVLLGGIILCRSVILGLGGVVPYIVGTGFIVYGGWRWKSVQSGKSEGR
jgi:hypothetical protein